MNKINKIFIKKNNLLKGKTNQIGIKLSFQNLNWIWRRIHPLLINYV